MFCHTDMKEKELIGIMGGTFDPPHLGHLLSAEYAAQQLNLSRVIFLPNGKTLYKKRDDTASPRQRFEMTKLAIEGNELFEISDAETVSDTVTFTCNTLKTLHKMYSNTHFYFIVGADSLDYIERWKNPEQIFELSSIAVVRRSGFSSDELTKKAQWLKEKFCADIRLVYMPLVEISSTDIKKRLKNGQSVRYMLPDLTLKYIKDNSLYINNYGDDSYDGRK